ncbi:MAG: thioesterase family protein [Candidatus Eisenbacteria bacterium]
MTQVRVYFSDTDQMGVVYNGNYLTWFEVGRTELMRDRGLSYASVEGRGVSLPVTEARFRVRRPALYDDLVQIETRLGRVRTRDLTFLYKLHARDQLLVEGETTHVAVGKDGGTAIRIPDWLRAGLE